MKCQNPLCVCVFVCPFCKDQKKILVYDLARYIHVVLFIRNPSLLFYKVSPSIKEINSVGSSFADIYIGSW